MNVIEILSSDSEHEKGENESDDIEIIDVVPHLREKRDDDDDISDFREFLLRTSREPKTRVKAKPSSSSSSVLLSVDSVALSEKVESKGTKDNSEQMKRKRKEKKEQVVVERPRPIENKAWQDPLGKEPVVSVELDTSLELEMAEPLSKFLCQIPQDTSLLVCDHPIKSCLILKRHDFELLPVVVHVVQGKEFCELMAENRLADRIRGLGSFENKVLVVQGLDAYFRSVTRTTRNEFSRAMRKGGPFVPSTAGVPTREELQKAFVHLQMDLKCQAHVTKASIDTTEFIFRLARMMALPKEKNQLNFGDVIRSGVNYSDTFEKILTLVPLASQAVAATVVQKYPCIDALYRAYERCYGKSDAENLLADLVITNRTAQNQTTRRIGPALSKRIYTVFMGLDPSTALSSSV